MLDINLKIITDMRFDAGGVLAMANNGPATAVIFSSHIANTLVRR
jgi:hypothetical protein